MSKARSRLLVRLTLVPALLVSLDAAAQGTGELITDRPDLTESAVVVGDGTIQLESGVSWQQWPQGASLWSGPELLLRWGIGDRLELRLAAPDRTGDEPGATGWTDSGIGFKLQLGPTGTGWDVAIIGAVQLPTGAEHLSSGSYDPELLLAVGRDLSNRWSLGSQVSATWTSGEHGGRTLLAGHTVVLGCGLSERTGTFFELATDRPESGTWPMLLHHGYTVLLTPTVQLDLHAGAGLNDAAPDLLLGVGLSLQL